MTALQCTKSLTLTSLFTDLLPFVKFQVCGTSHKLLKLSIRSMPLFTELYPFSKFLVWSRSVYLSKVLQKTKSHTGRWHQRDVQCIVMVHNSYFLIYRVIPLYQNHKIFLHQRMSGRERIYMYYHIIHFFVLFQEHLCFFLSPFQRVKN